MKRALNTTREDEGDLSSSDANGPALATAAPTVRH
jgi:hypothetical protein